MDRRSFITTAAGLTSVGLAGCSRQDGGASPAGTPTGTATSTPSPTEHTEANGTEDASSAQEAYPDYNWEVLEGVDPEPTTDISLRNTAFHPVVAEVPTGEPLTFENNDSFGHSVTIPALDVDRELDASQSTTVTVETTGQYDYVCTFHPPGMLGRLVVVDRTSTPTATDSGGTPTPTPTPTPTSTEDDGGYY